MKRSILQQGIKLSAPAKINVHLEIGHIREDGFHELCSVFQLINLYDEIEIQPDSSISGLVFESDTHLPSDNTVARSYELFKASTEIFQGCRIHLVKRIPQGSGLGGGSADAAAVLIGLNYLYNFPLNTKQLLKIAEEIGSDVPFFLHAAAAVVEGRGEVVTELELNHSYEAAVVIPEISISTPWAYKQLDIIREKSVLKLPGGEHFPVFDREACILQYQKRAEEWPFFNSFQPIMENKFPVYKEIHEELIRMGAIFTSLSGSGAAFIGIFSSGYLSDEKIISLRKRFYQVESVKILANSPFESYNIS
ncbi:MAG: 4-(cytidine 5'-diphospho)-2-C-methyl-D-erythritol kinase [Spirochaetia bacterium]|nr:4-(cytidine 5'-diphospho)-2-C-methyl-D-erythritol kinase [Spirochaetia bacterium]MCF7946714.1 4-(cytidine 5'-diphospho)-2-C-methyl-D-erythritol kinase [Spirochaetia bacterium]MCF7952718.1 4-(cytidine 5'-diphospho)-2-C-methyl-D-erythritol kinase [Spirochaetales bacterium]